MVLNKKKFADRMAAKGSITKAQAKREVNLFIETLIDCLKDEDIIKFHKFGRFELKTVKEKPAKSPATGKIHIVPEHKKVKFYAGETLDELMNN